MAVVYSYIEILTVRVLQSQDLRASAVNTPEDVSHSQGKNAEGKESAMA